MLQDTLSRKICARLPCAPGRTQQLERSSPIAPLILHDYEDPLTGARSMAALAPVAETGLIVLVSTPNSALEAIGDKMTDWLKKLLLIQVVLGAALLIGVAVGQRSSSTRNT